MRDPRLLLQFAAVAEALSFTEAARTLGVAQPWLSARIRKLEEQLGFALFVRSTRRVDLTPQGRELYEVIKPWAALGERVLGEIEAIRSTSAQRLRIGCPQLGEPDRRQAELIAHYIRDNPSVAVEIEPGSAAPHLDRLQQGSLDLVLTILDLDPRDWEWLELYPVRLAAMMRGDDPLVRLPTLTSSDLAGRRVAMFARARSRQLFDRVYAPLVTAGARQVTVPELRRSLLRSGTDLLVTTLVPEPAEAVLRHGVVRRVIDDVPPLSLKLVRRRGSASSRAAEWLWRIACELDAAGLLAEVPQQPDA